MASIDKLQLQKMIAANGTVDYTEDIRQTRHSRRIRDEVSTLLKAKRDYARLAKSNAAEFEKICLSRSNWLFMNYPDIYNRVYKDELNLQILNALLDKLEEIENGTLDQHEASVHVGTILKEMYIDSALRKADKMDKAEEKKNKRKGTAQQKPRKISYADFAKMNAE